MFAPRLTFHFPDSDDPRAPVRERVFEAPVEVLSTADVAQVGAAMRRAEEALRNGKWVAGYVAYEAAPAFDSAMRVRAASGAMPLLWLGVFDDPGGVTPAASGDAASARDRESAAVRGSRGTTDAAESADPTGTGEWEPDLSPEAHAAAVAVIRAAIEEGRTYQVNLTTRLRGRVRREPRAVYDHLRRAQGAGWHALLELDEVVIASASPELFFRVSDGTITTRPMKGTRPRGRWPGEDAARAAELASSPKDRAENLMIVDLLRNDLGRLCEPGTVRVRSLHAIERYRTVWQMTSTIDGRLRHPVRLLELFRALFPCGSVTGAPKISTMEVIAGVEASPREVYCGAIGFASPDGSCSFSVPIRTLWWDRETGAASYGTGGGVVWDSTAETEYHELVAKSAVLREAWPRFELLETLPLVDGRYPRLDRHLARIAASADYFGFPLPAGAIRARLDRLARDLPHGHHRVRLTVPEDGAFDVAHTPVASDDIGDLDGSAAPTRGEGRVRPVALADRPVWSADRFLYHKTTHRAVYDARRAEAGPDVFDVLLFNERGEITEFTRGNIVAELEGRFVTPPIEAGLLAGCLRAELLGAGEIEERTITVADLDRAERLWFVNSVRGWLRVGLRPRR